MRFFDHTPFKRYSYKRYGYLAVLFAAAAVGANPYAELSASSTYKPSTYSLDTHSLVAMQRELSHMLKQKILATPPVNPATALPPVILQSTDEKVKTPAPPSTFYPQLVAAAKDRTQHRVKYDGSYRYIAYPMGDVAPSRGVCTDVLIRSYRKLGVDLQQLVHEDMRESFHLYPSRRRWGNREPDPNIDHRRVYNLQVFFQRYGETLPVSHKPADYLPGDLVTWQLGPKMPHIGIVVDEYSTEHPERPLIVHNIGQGPKMEDILFTFPITGHYRYQPGKHTPRPGTVVVPLYVNEQREAQPLTTTSADNSLLEAAFFLLR